ncbi:MAG: hypothetical protein NVS4B1_07340 [Ktedonobacteraceae bacterium]
MHNKTQSFPRPCPECGGQRVRTTLNINPLVGMEQNELHLRQPKRVIGLGGLFSGQSNTSEVATVSCTNWSGYTTLYATQRSNRIPNEE